MSRYTAVTAARPRGDARRDRRRARSTSCSTRRSPRACGSGARSTCRRACPSRRSTRTCATSRARNVSRRGRDHVPRRRDVRPLRPGGRSTCCMSRSEFLTPYTPYQPEISPGRPAGDVRVPDGDLRADRRCRSPTPRSTRARARVAAAGYLAQARQRPPQVRRLARRAPAQPRDAAHARRAATAPRSSRSPLRDGVTDPDALGGGDRRRHGAVFFQQPNFLGAVEDVAALAGRRQGLAGASSSAPYDPLPLGDPRAARRVRRRRRRRRGPDARQPARLRRPVVRLLRRDRGLPAADARPHRRRDDRRRRPPRLRADAADARAAHPPREGDVEHLHRRRRSTRSAGVVYLAWLGREGIVELGELLLQRTAYARETLAALDGVELLHEQPVVREFALRLDAPVDVRA